MRGKAVIISGFCIILLAISFSIPLFSQENGGENSEGNAKNSDLSDFDRQLQNMAEELVKIRTEVDSLSTELSIKKNEMTQNLCTLGNQKQDLQRQLKNESVKVKDLDIKIDKQETEIARKKAESEELKGIVEKQIEKVRAYVKRSLPFKVKERLNELETMQTLLKIGEMPPDRVLARLWSMCEDEFRLTRESGMYSQDVEVSGNEILAKVVRLGMVLMYFQSIDKSRVGYAEKKEGNWEFVQIPENKKEQVEQVNYLFDCFKKHIQEGFFRLPNPYSDIEGNK